ncbi:MAG: hypothetical protein M1812_002811 [Candelaria pacifica]|nr:MAG: hypothetical protein M1812_002811 [Candelaria pacifica]
MDSPSVANSTFDEIQNQLTYTGTHLEFDVEAYVTSLRNLHYAYGEELTTELFTRHKDATITKCWPNLRLAERARLDRRFNSDAIQAYLLLAVLDYPILDANSDDDEQLAITRQQMEADGLSMHGRVVLNSRRLAAVEGEIRHQRTFQNGTNHNLSMRRRQEAKNDGRLQNLEAEFSEGHVTQLEKTIARQGKNMAEGDTRIKYLTSQVDQLSAYVGVTWGRRAEDPVPRYGEFGRRQAKQREAEVFERRVILMVAFLALNALFIFIVMLYVPRERLSKLFTTNTSRGSRV